MTLSTQKSLPLYFVLAKLRIGKWDLIRQVEVLASKREQNLISFVPEILAYQVGPALQRIQVVFITQ